MSGADHSATAGFPARKWLNAPPEFWIGLIGYFGLRNVLVASELTPTVAWLFTLVLLLPLTLIVRGVVRQILHHDELHRRIELEAAAYATAATIVLSLMLSSLEAQSVIPRVRAEWAAIALLVTRAIAASILKRRYG